MKYYIIGLKVVAAFIICGTIQSCYVQKGSEVHATVIHDQYPEDNVLGETQYQEMVTVEENIDPARSLEALSASLILIDIKDTEKATRWEDNLSFNFSNESNQTRWDDGSETLPSVITNN